MKSKRSKRNAAGSPGGTCDVVGLLDHLAAIPSGLIRDPADLERHLAASWHEFTGDDDGMNGSKLLTRMESVAWNPPILKFIIERHGSTVLGSSRAPLQQWTLDLDKRTAHCVERGYRQVRPTQPRVDVMGPAEEIAQLIVSGQQDDRLKWYEDGRVRVLAGKVLPKGSAVKPTLADRRKRFRAALRSRLEDRGWEEAGVNVYRRKGPEETA